MKQNKDLEYSDLNQLLDKMLKLEQSKKKVNIFKVILCIAGCIAAIVLIATLCAIVYKNNFSLESLLSLLLAFFSIFISVFFYFKTEETSNHFYDTSYNFMKDISVTLGKIEERFGEKLNNLSDKISHLSNVKEEKSEELQSKEDEKQKIINELMAKAKLNAKEKEEVAQKLRSAEQEIQALHGQLRNIDLQYNELLDSSNNSDDFSYKCLYMLAHGFFHQMTKRQQLKLISNGFVDKSGEITQNGKKFLQSIGMINE